MRVLLKQFRMIGGPGGRKMFARLFTQLT